jgi:hypothetical protein
MKPDVTRFAKRHQIVRFMAVAGLPHSHMVDVQAIRRATQPALVAVSL